MTTTGARDSSFSGAQRDFVAADHGGVASSITMLAGCRGLPSSMCGPELAPTWCMVRAFGAIRPSAPQSWQALARIASAECSWARTVMRTKPTLLQTGMHQPPLLGARGGYCNLLWVRIAAARLVQPCHRVLHTKELAGNQEPAGICACCCSCNCECGRSCCLLKRSVKCQHCVYIA